MSVASNNLYANKALPGDYVTNTVTSTVALTSGNLDQLFSLTLQPGNYALSYIYLASATSDASFNSAILNISGTVTYLPLVVEGALGNYNTVSSGQSIPASGSTVFSVPTAQTVTASIQFNFSHGTFSRTQYKYSLIKI